MRILFLNVGAELGGGERSLLDLIASFRQSHPDFDLHVAVGAEGPLVDHVRGLGAQCLVVPMPASLVATGDSGLRQGGTIRFLFRAPAAVVGAWRYARQLSRVVAELQPDVIHSNGIKFHLLTGLMRRSNALVVWHIRDFLGGRRLVAKALRWTRGADGAIAISHAVDADTRAIMPNVPVEIVYDGIDVDHFCPGPSHGAKLDELAGLPPAAAGVVRIGLVAAYARWKGQDIFLAAAAILAKEFSDDAVRFYIIGGPIYRTHGSQWSMAELRERAAAVGAGQVGFVGFQPDPSDIYRSLDVMVHASTQPEPYGRTVVEAMACHRAVVVANAGGAAELFTEGHDAVGVPPGDAALLADGLRNLIANPAQRKTLGENARQTALRRFARSRLGSQVAAAYASFRVSGKRFNRS